jgi:alkaline phosphatase D
MANHVSRRRFLRLTAMGVGAVVISSGLMACNSSDNDPDPSEKDAAKIEFKHGVASGDPLQDKVILWTRVSSDKDAEVTVSWEVATDQAFTNLVTTGVTTTSSERDYTVKIDAINLSSATVYYYRFKSGDVTSAIGKTKTLPEGSVEQVKLLVLSCSNYPAGFF